MSDCKSAIEPAPVVSVIVPVYNRERYVCDAIHSILGQTFRDFELIVVDDGSTDGSVRAVEAIRDPRLRLVRHRRNLGIPAARNTGLDEARGQLIAWLDSDDVARPNRLSTQVDFLARNPSIAMVGSGAGKMRDDGRHVHGYRVPPFAADDIHAWLLFRSAFQQSSILGRSQVLRHFRYREEFPVCEDHDVFIRAAAAHPLANLPRILVDRRLHKGQTVRQRQQEIRERKMALAAGMLRRIGASFDEDDLKRHALLGHSRIHPALVPADFLDWADAWMKTLRAENWRTRLFDPGSLHCATGYFWALACKASSRRLGWSRTAGKLLTSSLTADLVMAKHSRAWVWGAMRAITSAQLPVPTHAPPPRPANRKRLHAP